MERQCYNVLFLCTGNSARSILAESLINHWGCGKFRGFSAGSHPKGAMHSIALELLTKMNLPTTSLRSKSRDESAVAGAPPLDFVFTVCDNAAGEMCLVWPGQPMTAHWGVPDPAAIEGSDTEKWLAFRTAFKSLENRIKIFANLPVVSLDRIKLQQRVDFNGGTGMVVHRLSISTNGWRKARAGTEPSRPSLFVPYRQALRGIRTCDDSGIMFDLKIKCTRLAMFGEPGRSKRRRCHYPDSPPSRRRMRSRPNRFDAPGKSCSSFPKSRSKCLEILRLACATQSALVSSPPRWRVAQW